eukprot:gene3232-5676_t
MSKKKDLRMTIQNVEKNSAKRGFDLETPFVDSPTPTSSVTSPPSSPFTTVMTKKETTPKKSIFSAIKSLTKKDEETQTKKSNKNISNSKSLRKMDLSKYQINFDSLIIYPELNKDVSEFVCEEFKLDSYSPLLFINSCLALSTSSNYVDKLRITKEIINKFIEKDSENEIPISEEERKNIFENFKILITKEDDTNDETSCLGIDDTFDEIFEHVKELQFCEMYRDILPRYIRSKNCLNMMLKYKDDPEVIQSKKSAQFPYQNADFKREYLTKMDFDFMKSLSKDDLNWELIESIENELSIYFSDINVINNVTCVAEPTFIKYDIILPYSFEHVVALLTSTEEILNYSPNVKNIKILEDRSYKEILDFYSKEHSTTLQTESMSELSEKKSDEKLHEKNVILREHGACTLMIDIKLNFPMTTIRKYPVVIGCNYDVSKGEKLVLLWKPCEHESFSKDTFEWAKKSEYQNELNEKSQCYFMFDFQSHIFQKLDDKRTQYTQIHIGDVGGWAQNASLMRMVVKKRGSELRKNLIKHLSSRKELKSFKDSKEFQSNPIGCKIIEAISIGNKKKNEKRQKIRKRKKDESTPTI